jgi:hypothetical protein
MSARLIGDSDGPSADGFKCLQEVAFWSQDPTNEKKAAD